MSKKRGSYYISERNEKILKNFFGGVSNGITELTEVFNKVLSNIKIFTKKEVDDLLYMSQGWIMPLSKSTVSVEFEDWCKFELKQSPEEYDNNLYQKLINLDDISALAICRVLYYAWRHEKPAQIATLHLKEKSEP